MKKSRFLAGVLVLCMALTMVVAGVSTQRTYAAGNRVVTLGADLSAEQRAAIYQFFGTSADAVTVLTITNADEHAHLDNLIPTEVIGWQTFSCAYVAPTESNGIQVKTANLTYVTSEMIASTLSTSGVVNCDVVAAAPFPVSGTGALTGVIMAYESASGIELDPEKKALANEELVTTGELAGEIGQDEATLVVNDIKIRIIRDGASPEQVVSIVNEVLDTVNAAAASSGNYNMVISEESRNLLYEFGEKIAAMGYDFADMSDTLQRVAQNVTESTGIADPIMDTFDDKISNKIAEDSILNDTDDSALGLATNISTTFEDPADSEEVTFDGAMNADQVSLTARGSVNASDWVDNANVLEYRGSNGYGLMDIDGKALTEAVYTNLYGEYGYITGAIPNGTVNCEGMLNQAGDAIIPFKYGKVDVENRYWAVCWELTTTTNTADADARDFDDNYYNITTADIYFLENEQARLVATLSRDQLGDYDAYGKCINITNRANGTTSCYNSVFEVVQTGLSSSYSSPDGEYTGLIRTFRANGQQGLLDADGNVLLAPSFYNINLYEGRDYIQVSTGSKEGLIDWDGNIMIPALYDSIEYSYYAPIQEHARSGNGYAGNGYVTAIDNGKFLFLDVNGNVTSETSYEKDSAESVDVLSASVLYEAPNGQIHILAADGADTVVTGYNRVNPLYYSSGMLFRVQSENYSSGLIDWHGNVIFEPKFDRIALSADGQHLLAYEYSAGTYIFDITYDGPEYVPTEKEAVQVYEDDRPAVEQEVFASDISVTEYNRMDYSLNWIGSGNYLYEGSGSQMEDVDGNLLSDPYDSFTQYYGQYIEVTEKSGSTAKEGLINAAGDEIIPVTYDKLDIESSHWVVAFELEPTDADEGDFKNYSTDSYLVITNADIYYLNDGAATRMASLSREQIGDYRGTEQYIAIEDRSGNVNVYNEAFEVVESGLYGAYSTPESYPDRYQTYRDNGLYGIIDVNGNILLRAAYNYISIYADRGYAILQYDEQEGLADLAGNLLVPVQYDDIKNGYNQPLLAETGYNSSSAISHGYVAVEKDGLLGFSDINGNETVAPQYEEDNVSLNGASLLYTDASGVNYLVAGDGVVTELPAEYEYVAACSYGYGLLYYVHDSNYDYALMDWHGNLLLPFAYGSMSLSSNGEYVKTSDDNSRCIIFKIDYTGEGASVVADTDEADAAADQSGEDATAQAETSSEDSDEADTSNALRDMMQQSRDGEADAEEAEESAAEDAAPSGQDSPADDPAAAEDAANASAANPLALVLVGAKALAESDFDSNKDDIVTVLTQVAALAESSNEEAATLLGSAIQLIESGVADGPTTIVLIDTAIEQLK